MLAVPSLKDPWICIAIVTGSPVASAVDAAPTVGTPSVPTPNRPPAASFSRSRRPSAAGAGSSGEAMATV